VTIDAVHFVPFYTLTFLLGLSSVLLPRQHSICYMRGGCYRSKDPTNSIEVLKVHIVNRQIKHTISTHTEHKTQQVPYSTLIWSD